MVYVSVIRYVLNMSNQLDLPGTERKSSMHEYFSRDILTLLQQDRDNNIWVIKKNQIYFI